MAYEPYLWKDGNAGGTPLTADALNHLENGVDAAHDIGEAAATAAATKAPLARGLPSGGGAGQLLVKNSSADYAVGWQTPSTTVAAHTHPQSQVDNLSTDLAAIRTALFGGPNRTDRPHGRQRLTLAANANNNTGVNIIAGNDFAADTAFASTGDTVAGGTGSGVPRWVQAPVAGWYYVSGQVRIRPQASNAYFNVSLLKNDVTEANRPTSIVAIGEMLIPNINNVILSASNYVYLVANDRIYMSWAVLGGSAFTLLAPGDIPNATYTNWSISWVGP